MKATVWNGFQFETGARFSLSRPE